MTMVKKAPGSASAMGEDPGVSRKTISMGAGGNMSQVSSSSQPAPQIPAQDMCQIHNKPIEIICIDCKERICSNCALFGNHKGHDIRMEQEVLDEINLRTECLMEMYQIVDDTAQSKPNEQEVNAIHENFQKKSMEMRNTLKQTFKNMRNILIVQEQTTEAILMKNLAYVEKELKSL